ncbi:MAG: rhodanese-like domain-containing protein [Caldilineaceae bacterium]
MSFFNKLFGGLGMAGADDHELSAAQYKERFVTTNTPHMIVDVRSPAEFAGGHLTGALNLPLQNLSQKLTKVPKNKPVMVYCRSGNRSGMALKLLREAGYEEVYNIGGLNGLAAQGLPIDR